MFKTISLFLHITESVLKDFFALSNIEGKQRQNLTNNWLDAPLKARDSYGQSKYHLQEESDRDP